MKIIMAWGRMTFRIAVFPTGAVIDLTQLQEQDDEGCGPGTPVDFNGCIHEPLFLGDAT